MKNKWIKYACISSTVLPLIPINVLSNCSSGNIEDIDCNPRFATPEIYELNVSAFSGRHGTIKLHLLDKYKDLIVSTPNVIVKTPKFQDSVYCTLPVVDGNSVTIDFYLSNWMEEDEELEFDLVFKGSTWQQIITGFKSKYQSKTIPDSLLDVENIQGANQLLGFISEVKSNPILLIDYDVFFVPDYVNRFPMNCIKEFAPYCKRVEFSDNSECTSIGNDVFNNFPILKTINIPPKLIMFGTNFCANCPMLNCEMICPEPMESIGSNFLYNCPNFNSKVDVSHAVYIGENFIAGCPLFNQELDLSNVKSIGSNFLMNDIKYDKKIKLSETTFSLGWNFLYNAYSIKEIEVNCSLMSQPDTYALACDNKNAPMYKNGITLSGDPTKVADFMQRYPNSDEEPYRKLISL